MKKYFYDLHIHSCLSPCGDNDSTPDSIAGMGELNGLDIMALTDHNSCKNCPAFFKAAHRHGILPVAGMELTTSEEIHAVCLFGTLESALEFDREIEKRRILIPNRKDIFGEQLICDDQDNIVLEEEYLLSNATAISLEEAPMLVEKYGGICFPAHIDRNSNSITSVLGVFPKSPVFTCAEVFNSERLAECSAISRLPTDRLLVNSDAHYLWDIKEKSEFVNLDEIPRDCDNAGEFLLKALKENL